MELSRALTFLLELAVPGAGVALYLLQRIPSEQAVQPLARYLKSGRVSGMNSELASQAFLTTARIDSVNEDPVFVATHEAEKFL